MPFAQMLSFSVEYIGATTSAFTVSYATADGIARVSNGDYQATSGTLSFSGVPETQFINVPINGDGKVELNETPYNFKGGILRKPYTYFGRKNNSNHPELSMRPVLRSSQRIILLRAI